MKSYLSLLRRGAGRGAKSWTVFVSATSQHAVTPRPETAPSLLSIVCLAYNGDNAEDDENDHDRRVA